MRITLLNGSKRVKSNEVVIIAAAIELQMARHLAPSYDISPTPVSVSPDAAHVPPGSHVIAILDNPDEPDALGWHTEQNGVYYGRVFVNPVLQNGGVVLFDPRDPNNTSVASVISHEALEMRLNPFVNKWADGVPIPEGDQYSYEIGDPVESDQYAITVGTTRVSVSNFVFPEWFDPQTPRGKRVDYLSRLHAPFTMTPGGYMVVRQSDGNETAVYGEHYPQWRKAMKAAQGSRLSRIVRKKTVAAV